MDKGRFVSCTMLMIYASVYYQLFISSFYIIEFLLMFNLNEFQPG